MIEWFAKKSRQKSLYYTAIVIGFGLILPFVIVKIEPSDRPTFLLLGCFFGAGIFASIYCVICELSAEVLRLRGLVAGKVDAAGEQKRVADADADPASEKCNS